MSKGIHAGELAVDYLIRHPGFENRIWLAHLMAALRLKDGSPLPYDVAVGQRIGDLIRAHEKNPTRGYDIRRWYERERGAVKRVFFWLPCAEARRILKAKATRKVRT